MKGFDLQDLIDGMSARAQRERTRTQETLGAFIVWLEAHDPDERIVGLGGLASYRGFYSDLAFESDDTSRTVADVLHECRRAMGQVFEGYKGGDFVMGALTPLWVSSWGVASGQALVGMARVEGSPVWRPITRNTYADEG